MKITELLDINSIDLNPQISNKEEAIDHLVNLLDQSGKLNDKEIYKESVLNRRETKYHRYRRWRRSLMDKVKV